MIRTAEQSVNWGALGSEQFTEDDWECLRCFMVAVAREFAGEGGSQERIEDSVQEMMVLFQEDDRKIRHLSEARNPKSYLAKMVKHHLVDESRSDDSHERCQQEYAERIIRTSSVDPVRLTIKAEETALLHEAVRQLSEIDRTLITAFHLDGETISDLAERFEITPTNVTSRLARARQKLRQLLCR